VSIEFAHLRLKILVTVAHTYFHKKHFKADNMLTFALIMRTILSAREIILCLTVSDMYAVAYAFWSPEGVQHSGTLSTVCEHAHTRDDY